MTADMRLDACPECGEYDNRPTTTTPVPNGVRCTYECRNCHGQWECSWWGVDD